MLSSIIDPSLPCNSVRSARTGSTRSHSGSLAVNRWIVMLGVSVALTCSHGVLAAEVANFARLALSCVHKEYPNHISHTLQGDADVAPPRELTPAFYGCLDWHSSVHGHWLLARLVRLYPESAFAEAARTALAQSLTEGIAFFPMYFDEKGFFSKVKSK